MTKALHLKLLFVLLLTTKVTTAQLYHPLLGNFNEWDVYVNMIPVVANNEENVVNMPYQSGAVVTSDTVINAIPYKKVYSISDPNIWGIDHPRFLREDTVAKKVYLLSADSLNERVLYDFSLSVGDSLYLSWEYQAPNVGFNNGYYTLDSTGLIATNVGVRTSYYLSSLANVALPFQPLVLEWIEGIGSTISPVYLDEDFGYGFPTTGFIGCTKYYMALTCAYTDSVQTYRDSCMSVFYNFFISNMNDSCIYNITGGLNEKRIPELTLSITPNPLVTSTTINLNGKNLNHYKTLNLSICNTMGLIVKSVVLNESNLYNGITLYKDNLKAGLYSIRISDNGKTLCTSKLMID